MISAHEALRIAEKVNGSNNELCEVLDVWIRSAANKGKLAIELTDELPEIVKTKLSIAGYHVCCSEVNGKKTHIGWGGVE